MFKIINALNTTPRNYLRCFIKMMHIKLLPLSEEVSEFYVNHSTHYPGDCGLDLFCCKTTTIAPRTTGFVDLGIKIAAYRRGPDGSSGMRSVGWLLMPRSSIAKTPLRLANSGMFDFL